MILFISLLILLLGIWALFGLIIFSQTDILTTDSSDINGAKYLFITIICGPGVWLWIGTSMLVDKAIEEDQMNPISYGLANWITKK